MTQIAYVDLAKLVDDAGFPGGTPQAMALAICAAESGRNPAAKNVNTDEWQSVDRGLWQINDHWHPEVTDECAYDPACAAKAALTISQQGSDWSPWATFGNGAYKTHMEAAKVALDAWARIKPLNAKVAAQQAQIGTLSVQVAALTSQLAVVQQDEQAMQTQVSSLSDGLSAARKAIDAALAALQPQA